MSDSALGIPGPLSIIAVYGHISLDSAPPQVFRGLYLGRNTPPAPGFPGKGEGGEDGLDDLWLVAAEGLDQGTEVSPPHWRTAGPCPPAQG